HVRVRRRTGDAVAQRVAVVDWLPVEVNDHVALLEARALARAARHNLTDDDAAHVFHVETLRDVRSHGLHDDAELTAPHLARLDQLIHDAARHVGRNGKTDAD